MSMRRTAPATLDPMTMSIAAINKEISAIMHREKMLRRLEKQIELQDMEDTDRCLALKAALATLTWPSRSRAV